MRRVVIVAIAALFLVPLYVKSRPGREIPARTAFRVLSSNSVMVKVSGEVRHSGVYEVSANTVADTVIKMAEPLHPQLSFKTDSSGAYYLPSGAHVRLILHNDGYYRIALSKMAVPERLVLGIPLDIADMSEADFDRLPGIGPKLAQRIIDYRQNNGGKLRVVDLALVEGIGEKKFNALCRYFQHPVNTE
jgi:competence protein ComEA